MNNGSIYSNYGLMRGLEVMVGKTSILGANLMEISSTMIFKTNVFSLPWRRNILTGLWLIGFTFFCIGLKMNGE